MMSNMTNSNDNEEILLTSSFSAIEALHTAVSTINQMVSNESDEDKKQELNKLGESLLNSADSTLMSVKKVLQSKGLDV